MVSRDVLINSIIRNYKLINPKYLEVGVWTGETFKNINSNNKDGIDPEQYCKSDYVNYKMTSDVFFNTCTQKYDIIFIDGLHTAFQVTKDIYNSINHLNEGGWVIIDDVYPHCEYEQERLNLRKTGPQTGDVWKGLYNILDELTCISDIMYFEQRTERGNFIFKIKNNNNLNITIDTSMPVNNTDGWYNGTDAEWDKYKYSIDFNNYLSKLNKINETSKFICNY